MVNSSLHYFETSLITLMLGDGNLSPQKNHLFVCLLFLGPEATLPNEAAQEFQTIEVNQELFEELQEIAPRDGPRIQQVVDGPKAETQKCY